MRTGVGIVTLRMTGVGRCEAMMVKARSSAVSNIVMTVATAVTFVHASTFGLLG